MSANASSFNESLCFEWEKQRWRESENFEVEFQTNLSNVSKIAKGFDLFMAFSEMNATTNLLLDITAVFWYFIYSVVAMK